MTRKVVAMFLVLVIGLSPVVSAFATCAGAEYAEMNGMAPHSFGIGAYAVGVSTQKSRTNSQDSTLPKMNCHSDGHCVFHLCGGFGLTASNQFTPLFHTNFQSTLSQPNIKDRVLTPEVRPPIVTV